MHYNDSDILKPVFSCLVIRVSSIVKYFTSISEFSDGNKFYGETNGDLFISAEMCTPAFRLEAFAAKTLVPRGMVQCVDFIFLDELSPVGHTCEDFTLVDIEHPHCNSTSWLRGIIIDSGNYIWYNDPTTTILEQDAKMRLLRNLGSLDKNVFKLNPRVYKIDDTFVYYTLSNSQMNFKIHRDALWYNEKLYGPRHISKK